jgi:ribosomal protein L1
MGYRDIPAINELISGMQSAEPAIDPIILKHRQVNRVDLGPIYGLRGFTIRAVRKLSGSDEIYASVDPAKQVEFLHDKHGVQWAVAPDCDFNRKCLLDNMATLRKIFSVVEAPEDFLKLVAAKLKEPVPERPKGKKVSNPNNDPFFGAKLNKELVQETD